MSRESRSDMRRLGAGKTHFAGANFVRCAFRTLLLIGLVVMGAGTFSSDAKAALYCDPTNAFGACLGGISFTYTVSHPELITTAIFVTPAPGSEFGNFGEGPAGVDHYLGTLFGPLPARMGGACGINAAVDNFCSGGTTQAGHSSLSGNLFAVHIGGQDGALLAFLYSDVITGFDISFTAVSNDITGLSSIWAYNTVVTPIPAALLLFGSGLCMLGLASRRRKTTS